MIRSIPPLIVSGIGLASALLSSCVQMRVEANDIVLRSYDASNYAMLNRSLGQRACIVGTLSVDVIGARFLLQPYEEDGVLAPSPSRVKVDLSPDLVAQRRLESGQVRRVCGVLHDATPWEGCDRDDCRWYELRESELR